MVVVVEAELMAVETPKDSCERARGLGGRQGWGLSGPDSGVA